MFVNCRCGARHWGRRGAAGLLLTDDDRTGVVLQKRSARVHQGGTWGVPGGAIEPGEDPVTAALREAHEESGVEAADVRVVGTVLGTDHVDWRYTYVVGVAERPEVAALAAAGVARWEADLTTWVDLDHVEGLRLHPGLRTDWPLLRGRLTGRGPAG